MVCVFHIAVNVGNSCVRASDIMMDVGNDHMRVNRKFGLGAGD